jgi:hypothetical protein
MFSRRDVLATAAAGAAMSATAAATFGNEPEILVRGEAAITGSLRHRPPVAPS